MTERAFLSVSSPTNSGSLLDINIHIIHIPYIEELQTMTIFSQHYIHNRFALFFRNLYRILLAIDRLLELPRLTSVPQKRTQLQMSPLWPPHRQKPRQSNPRTAMSKQTVLGAFPNFAKHAEKLSEMKPKKGCTSTPKKQTTLDSFIQLSKRKAVVIDPADVERETYEWNGVVTLQEQLKCEKKKHRVPGTQHTQKQ
jgi:hypothetical protein